MRAWLESEGLDIVELADGASALSHAGRAGAICLDLGLADMPGMEVLERLLALDPELPILVVTAERSVEAAVDAMRAGAYDFVTKPLDRRRLVPAVRRALERRALTESVHALRSELDGETRLVGESGPMRELGRQIERVLSSDVAVAIFGESGTGKELVARTIHDRGRRRAGPFVAVNCGAIPESLQESELFGHERGAFTGAVGQHRGRFEQAHGGTLLLDEVGEMSPATQASLLRTLQERTVRRVGGERDVPIDVRIVCATHRDLEQDVAAGRFRQDLYYRLVVYPLRLPALRERAEDIPALVGHFMRRLAEDTRRAPPRVDPAALEALVRYPWPGNVRELQNVVHRTLLAADGDRLELAHLPPAVRQAALPPAIRLPKEAEAFPLLPLRELERRAIRRAIEATGGNVTEAARLLGIGRATIYRRLAELEAELETERAAS
ncbi:MAG: sigma-54-dependent Fis family transcriptional regulator [Sandaracinaceae bacterium]|nr:sigma-54-dependent Fis family transcriptional regulator [Sandaracinaceae bacterium]